MGSQPFQNSPDPTLAIFSFIERYTAVLVKVSLTAK
jgi:hypothetical protein|tara:strand:- start:191 stop:298 length:108 start_codon:yes stop_codon:yes gene_type:complete